MITTAARKSLLVILVEWIRDWIKYNIVSEGYEDENGFHYR